MFTHEERMKAALAMLAYDLKGRDTIDSLRPISSFAKQQLANLARAAYFNEPHDKLDEVMGKENSNV